FYALSLHDALPILGYLSHAADVTVDEFCCHGAVLSRCLGFSHHRGSGGSRGKSWRGRLQPYDRNSFPLNHLGIRVADCLGHDYDLVADADLDEDSAPNDETLYVCACITQRRTYCGVRLLCC